MHYLSSVYFVNQPLHVSGMFVAHHQEVHCIYIYIYIYNWSVGWDGVPPNTQSTTKHNMPQLLYIYIYSIPPDDGLQICPKHV